MECICQCFYPYEQNSTGIVNSFSAFENTRNVISFNFNCVSPGGVHEELNKTEHFILTRNVISFNFNNVDDSLSTVFREILVMQRTPR